MRFVAGSILTYLVFAACCLICLPLQLVLFAVAPFDRTRRLPGRLFRQLAVVVAGACPFWTMRIEGAALRPAGACVVVANHESALDPVLLAHLPWEVKWLAKASILRIPWLGWIMRLAGDIAVVRGDAESGSAAMRQARTYLALGMPVLIFPEGTRTRDGSLLPFKPGAFRLAIEAGVPVLPIALCGTAAALPVRSPWVRPTRAVARVLSPVAVAGLTVEALRDLVRDRIDAARTALVLETPAVVTT